MGSGHPSSPGEDLVLKVEPVLSGSHLLANSSSHEVVVCMARLSTTCQNYTRAEMEITHNPLPWEIPVKSCRGSTLLLARGQQSVNVGDSCYHSTFSRCLQSTSPLPEHWGRGWADGSPALACAPCRALGGSSRQVGRAEAFPFCGWKVKT